MTNYTHQTAPTGYVEANGTRFAYRRFGKAGEAPLIFNMHFMGTMDHWDLAVTDGFAKEREVVLFDNAGVSSSSGEVPATFAEVGANAIAFIKALRLKEVDVLGFSIGGLVAQEIALQASHLSAAWCWSALDRAAATAWIPVRRKANRSSARTMSIRTTFGFAFTLRRRKRAKPPGADFSNASGCAPKIATPR
jgi:pimeloyl-ACP methyl ester carboxylesterase